MERNLVLAATIVCTIVGAIAVWRLEPRRTDPEAQAAKKAATQWLGDNRGFILLFGIASIVMGVGMLFLGFQSGTMEYVPRHGPSTWITYTDHKTFFVCLGAFYAAAIMFGSLVVKIAFDPDIAVHPLVKHLRVVGAIWLCVILAIFAFIFFR